MRSRVPTCAAKISPRDPFLQRDHLGEPALLDVGGDVVGQLARGVGPLALRVREHERAVEAQLRLSASVARVFLLGLAAEPDQDVGRDRDAGHAARSLSKSARNVA